jgi:integrase
MQRGNILKKHGAWHLRYYTSEVVNGAPVRRQVMRRLAPVNDQYRSKGDVLNIAQDFLTPENRGLHQPEGGLTLTEFSDRYFFPYVASKRKPSTLKFYKDVFANHLKDRVGHLRLREFTTRHAQDVLDGIPLSHQSLLRIKTGMSAIFTYARQRDFIRTANPVQGTKAEGKRIEPERYAYSLKEVEHILAKLSEPARTVCALAAFTGLSEGEIRGLRWEDYDGAALRVRRTVWRTHVGDTKTDTRRNSVPVIPVLQKILAAHRKRTPNAPTDYIFAGEKKRFALHLDNLSRRVIKPALGSAWHGWHAFRRGLATNLFTLGVPAEAAQTILRHANVSTTRTHYIVLESRNAGRDAMRRLERAVSNKGQVRDNRRARNRKHPHKH